MIEEWKTVDLAPNYAVSCLGRVKRIGGGRAARVGRILKLVPDKDGYLSVSLSTNHTIQVVKVHKLVLLAFVGSRPTSKHQGAHGDGDCTNNRADNLSWKTSKENHADKLRHGTHGITLTVDDVLKIRKMRSAKKSYDVIAAAIGCTKSGVAAVATGRSWGRL